MFKTLFTLFVILIPFLKAEISDEEFLKLKKELTTDKDETWKTIPWKLSVIEAQNVAVKTKKPIFIWAMDGHPLACV